MTSRFALVLATLCSGAQAAQFNVLVFSKTAGWRHDAIPAAVKAIEELGRQHDFNVVATEDAGAAFNDQELSKYQAVVFLLTTGDILNAQQKAAFERYIHAGGGYVGVHSASDTEYGWPWYAKLVGHMFEQHPAIQTAVLKVEDRNFPGMDGFAKRTLVTDEWYNFHPAASKLNYLLTVDETSYQPGPKGMGTFHPVSWYHDFENGRAFYTALGHLPASYGDALLRRHLFGGMYWAATGKGFRAE
ncbi:ThuA domain-containing protein [Pseudoduganella eburnea]|uniref:ThuA domain-containing protein n=1 Tax=Massilia eburnea TaxID=1776165 RepID=A0A6L6QK53_9BURK|nr:ThuA domain-containing protein [Massilia eburnea]MTW12036.1 ThuA domain-containing protein [Massilia eburnea]